MAIPKTLISYMPFLQGLGESVENMLMIVLITSIVFLVMSGIIKFLLVNYAGVVFDGFKLLFWGIYI